MNKKFINLLLASVLAVSSAQVFTSCKDNEADLQANVQYQYESLEKRVAANEDFIKNTLPGQLQALENNLTTKINQVHDELDKQMKDYKQQLLDSIKAAKDDLQAQIDQNKGDIKVLKDSVADLDSLYKALKGELDTFKQETLDKFVEHDAALKDLRDSIETNITEIANLRADLTIVQARQDSIVEVLKRLPALEETVADHAKRLTEVEAALGETQLDLANFKTEVYTRLEPLEKFMNDWSPILPEIQQNAATALALANANAASIEAINTTIEDLKDADASNLSLITGLQMQIDDMLARMEEFATLTELAEVSSYLQEQAKEYYQQSIAYTNLMIEQVLAQFAAEVENIYNEIGTVKDFMDALALRVDALEGELYNLAGDVDALTIRVSNIENGLSALTDRVAEISDRISGIVIQGTVNNAIGSLRLPVGIQSNLLIGYVGEVANASGEVEFPLVNETAGTYNGDISNSLTTAEATALGVGGGVVPIETYSGYYMSTTESNPNAGYLGTVYATINPTKVNLDNKSFSLVNSRGEKVANPLTFEPSDVELDFGYSRSAENGFYEAAATVDLDEASLKSIYFHFDDNLKNTVRDIISDPKGSANRNTVSLLAKEMVEQLNGFLPAIGIEATWTDSELGQMCVTTNYALATAVAKPLSFTFLQGVNLKNIPNLPTLSKIQDKFNAIIDDVTGDLKIDLTSTPFTITLTSGTYIVKPTINIPSSTLTNPTIGVNVYDSSNTLIGTGSATIDFTAVNSQIDAVKSAIEDAFSDDWVGDMNDNINNQLQSMCSEIAAQVDNLISTMETKVNDTIANAVSKLQNKVNGIFSNSKLNGLMNRIDAVINRLNSILDNPNHYLQPALFYSTDTEFAEVSRNSYVPTLLVLESGANAINIVPTSYTYEIVAPICKKYVAVTAAWENGDASRTNKTHIALEANNNTNFNTNMNQVVDGSCRNIALKLQKGYTYEVFYQALDFNGYVSGGKYYISVK